MWIIICEKEVFHLDTIKIGGKEGSRRWPNIIKSLGVQCTKEISQIKVNGQS